MLPVQSLVCESSMLIQMSKRITVATIFMGLFLVVPWVTDSSFSAIQKFRYQQMHASDFFLYHDIVPSKDTYQIGEQITFFSFNDTYRPVHYYWNDRLWCDLDSDNTGYHLVGVHQDDLNVAEPSMAKLPEDTSAWDFTGAHPRDTGICYLKSITTVEVGYGVDKVQTFIGKQFNIVE